VSSKDDGLRRWKVSACTLISSRYYNCFVVCGLQTKCNSVVDKYTEYDNIIISLDALLHKSQAYRHLLFNIHILVSLSCCFYFSVCFNTVVLIMGKACIQPA